MGDDRSNDNDNEGIHPRFRGVFERLLDADIPLQVQHFARRGAKTACGEVGQQTDYPNATTCTACRLVLANLALAAKARAALRARKAGRGHG
jgi:hypothetical protein